MFLRIVQILDCILGFISRRSRYIFSYLVVIDTFLYLDNILVELRTLAHVGEVWQKENYSIAISSPYFTPFFPTSSSDSAPRGATAIFWQTGHFNNKKKSWKKCRTKFPYKSSNYLKWTNGYHRVAIKILVFMVLLVASHGESLTTSGCPYLISKGFSHFSQVRSGETLWQLDEETSQQQNRQQSHFLNGILCSGSVIITEALLMMAVGSLVKWVTMFWLVDASMHHQMTFKIMLNHQLNHMDLGSINWTKSDILKQVASL